MVVAKVLSGISVLAGVLGTRAERNTLKLVMVVSAGVLIAAAAGLSALFPQHRKRLAIACFVLGGISLVLAGVSNWGVLSEDTEVSGITTLAAGATGLALLVLGGTFYRLQKDVTEE